MLSVVVGMWRCSDVSMSLWQTLFLPPWSPMPSMRRLTCPVPTDVSCDEWAFSLLPLDVDLLSMELPEFFRDYFLVSAGSLGLGNDRQGQVGSSELATLM